MAYTPTVWEESVTPLGPTNMNHIEQGIKEAHEKLEPTALATLLLDIFHPVGMYFETKDSTFNPNTAWGGTWVLEQEGLVHVSGGANYPVTANAQDGGEATHTLTIEEMPAHNHGQAGAHTHQLGRNKDTVAGGSKWDKANNASATTDRGYTSTIAGAHTHSTNGGGQAHNNMQPYKNVYRWLRTE